MRIDVLTVNGSPKNIVPSDIYGRGVGGAELSLMSWAEVMAKRGHEVRVFNQTNIPLVRLFKGVSYMPDDHFRPDEERDLLVTFRGPQDIALAAKAKKKFGWSCDQYTEGNYVAWYRDMDEIIVISDFHKNDHLERYGEIANKARVIDLGVRTWEYDTSVAKVPYQFIYCSVPDRGLNVLFDIWPQIKAALPEATLIITSDYTLWGASDPLNMEYRLRFSGLQGVKFLGNIPRDELVRKQLESEIQIYPCIYDENFCIATAECQVAGCYCVTSGQGALKTTNSLGFTVLPESGIEGYVRSVMGWYNIDSEHRKTAHQKISQIAKKRFDWDEICLEWELLING